MATSYTRNLKLRIDSNLTANAKYNLDRLDALGSTFLVDTSDVLNIRSLTDISIEPESADLGGSGSNGIVSIGTASHEIDTFNVYASEVNFSDAIGTLDQATSGTKYLRIKYDSTVSGSVDTAADRTLSIDLQGANRSLAMGGNLQTIGGSLILTMSADTALSLPTTGTLATLAGVEALTHKSIDADLNTLTNIRNTNVASDAAIAYSKLNLAGSIVAADLSGSAAVPYSALILTNSIVNADVASAAGISYSKLNLTGSVLNADISASAQIAYSKLNLSGSVANADISSSAAIAGSKIAPQFGNQAITGNSIEFTNGTNTFGLTPSGSQSGNIALTLPTDAPTAGQVLRANALDTTQLEWVTAGGGTVSSVGLSMPAEFSVAGTPVTGSGTLAVTKANQISNVVFAGPATGSAAAPTFRALVVADIPSGVDHGNLSGLSDDDHTQYHNDSRALTWLGTRSTLDLPENTNLYYTAARFDTAFSAKSTTDLSEGSKLYFTDERAQDAVGGALTDSSSVDFTYNDAGGTISAAVLPAGVDHDSLLNYSANKHVDHTAVTISGASNGGLSGGGTLAASRTLSVDPTNATSASIATGDIILFADISAANALKQTTVSDLLSLGGGSFAADWTSGTTKTVTHSLGSRDVIVQLYDNTTYETIEVDTVIRTDTNTVDLTASAAPSGSGWRVLIKKI